jgi:hypothetical protein
MSFVRRFLTATSALALVTTLAGAPRLAHAAGIPTTANDAAAHASLEAERQRLRGELQRVNAEIESLKRAERGVRDDYRLRARLADAEALARRLTELDARLGRAPDRPGDRSMLATEPRALPGDGPAELEAKADILSDESHRLAARAGSILGRARELRARQNLRRHGGQMERDPFSPLEGSKRRALAAGVSMPAARVAGPAVSNGTPGTATSSDTAAGAGNVAQTPATNPSVPAVGGATLGGGTATVSAPAPGSAPTGMTTPGMTASPATKEGIGGAVTTPRLVPSSVSDGAATLSVQLRDLLDPVTLAEIQRLEAAGGVNSGFEALERAGAALKARADRLAQQAASLRASEHVTPRTR